MCFAQVEISVVFTRNGKLRQPLQDKRWQIRLPGSPNAPLLTHQRPSKYQSVLLLEDRILDCSCCGLLTRKRGTVGLTLQIVSLLLVNFLPPTLRFTIASIAIAIVLVVLSRPNCSKIRLCARRWRGLCHPIARVSPR